QHVDDEVDRYDDDGDEHHQVLHHRVVAPANRLDEEARDAGNVEDGLGDDQSAQQKGGLDTDHRDDRQERVLERMVIVDNDFGSAFRTGGADIVLPQHVEHRGSRQTQ